MSLPLIMAPLSEAFAALGSIGSTLQAALAIGTTATGFIADKQRADAEEAAVAQANDEARKQAISDYDQITRRGQEEKQAAGAKQFEVTMDRKKTVARAEASASEAGIGGLSVTSLLSDIYGQEARIRDGVNMNLDAAQSELRNTADGIARNHKNVVTTRAPVSRPSLFGAVLQGASGVYGAFKDDLKVNAKTK